MWRIDGQPEGSVLPSDRGLAYGDGVFRTLRVEQGVPLQWDKHWATLNHDAQRLAIPCPAPAVWLEDIAALAAAHGDGIIKCTLTRGVAGRGYAPPQQVQPTRIVQWSALPCYPAERRSAGVALHLCHVRLARQPLLAGIKHLNRLENVLARAEWDDPAIAEGLLLDDEGVVVEGTMSNILWRSGALWFTPRLDRCGVAGVTRACLMKGLAAAGAPVLEVHAPLEQVLRSDEVVLCNSIIGVWPVRSLLQRRWSVFPTISSLERILAGEST